MQIVEKQVVSCYRWDKHAAVYQALVGLVLVLIAFATLGAALKTSNSDTMGGWMCIGVVSGCIAFVLFCQPDGEPFKRDSGNNAYPLLERWEKYSRLSIFEFPTSEYQLKVLKAWAEYSLWLMATHTNEAFAQQTEARRKVDEYCRVADPLDPDKKISQIKILQKDIDSADKLAREHKAQFLGFWDLVTEKDGLGILTGPEWQDPEVFRKNLEQLPCSA